MNREEKIRKRFCIIIAELREAQQSKYREKREIEVETDSISWKCSLKHELVILRSYISPW